MRSSDWSADSSRLRYGDLKMSPDAIVEVKKIGKIYDGGVEALRDVSLGLPRGRLTTLLGPSGCGKTTLLKVIAGLVAPTGGEVLVGGRRVTGPGPERAFVFQDFALLPWATVLRNVGFGLELRGEAREAREETARRWIGEVGLAGFEQSYPHQLSGGMRQRVGLARALAVDAEIILMDEPFSAVDERTRRKFQEDLLVLLRDRGKTVLFVTHSIEEAVYLSDRIVLLTPRPGTGDSIVQPSLERGRRSPDEIRRDKGYLDAVDESWLELKQHVGCSARDQREALGPPQRRLARGLVPRVGSSRTGGRRVDRASAEPRGGERRGRRHVRQVRSGGVDLAAGLRARHGVRGRRRRAGGHPDGPRRDRGADPPGVGQRVWVGGGSGRCLCAWCVCGE